MKTVIEKLRDNLLELLIAGLLTPAMLVAAKLLPEEVIKKVDSVTWFRLVVALVIFSAGLTVYILKKRPRFIYNPEHRIYYEKKTGNPFCPSCMANGKRSHLHEYEAGWRCMTKDCKGIYYKPGIEPKPQERRVIHPGIDGGWVHGWKK